MKNVVVKSMIIMMLVLFISGCNEEREKKVSKLDPIEKNVDIDSNDRDGLFRKFEKSVPDATVYNDAMFDIDGDGKKDLIVIYDTPENKVNFAIVAAGRGVSSTSLEGDVYSFTYVLDSLKVYESQKKFIITLHDETKNFTVDYEITKDYDKEKNATTLKIKSMNAR
ncbi:hypothetical protein ACQKMV_12880 [Lysinibacillus sp. NPDC094403]|uniref:hypothetical protein n=1 Tax=Lysinibacillus sp. NPDC094403 TaxID=3390581 RepID=UPI003D023702